jgi:hypothetical protein
MLEVQNIYRMRAPKLGSCEANVKLKELDKIAGVPKTQPPALQSFQIFSSPGQSTFDLQALIVIADLSGPLDPHNSLDSGDAETIGLKIFSGSCRKSLQGIKKDLFSDIFHFDFEQQTVSNISPFDVNFREEQNLQLNSKILKKFCLQKFQNLFKFLNFSFLPTLQIKPTTMNY